MALHCTGGLAPVGAPGYVNIGTHRVIPKGLVTSSAGKRLTITASARYTGLRASRRMLATMSDVGYPEVGIDEL